MSFTSVGTLGHNSEKVASDREITLSPSRNVAVGHLVIVWVGSTGDSNYADANGRNDPWCEIQDDAGNIWCQLMGGLDAGAGAVDYTCYAIFCCQLQHAITTSTVITARTKPAVAHGDFNAKAISAWEFTLDAGKVWASVDLRKASVGNYGTALSTFSMTSLPASTEFLALHALSAARPKTDSYTWDSNYTQIDSDGTSTGGASADVTLRGGWRVVTATTVTVGVTNTTANPGVARQGLVALTQVDYDSEFPTFPFLDTFSYADQDPLPDPPWDDHTGNKPGSGTADIRVVSNQAARSTVGTQHGAQFLNNSIPAGDDGEIFATMAVVGLAGLRLFDSGSGTNNTLAGYGVNWLAPVFTGHNFDYLGWGGVGFNGGIGEYVLRVFANRVNGAKFGLQARQSGVLLHLWVDLNDGDGYRWVGCDWITGSSICNGGFFGLNFLNDFTTRIDDFGGGTSSPFTPVGQIFRRLP